MRLAREGLTVTEVTREIDRRLGVRLDSSHIWQWVKGGVSPFGRVQYFEPRSIPELAYVIGARVGGGSLSKNWHHNYIVKLRVTDRDFAVEFARCAGVILNHRPYGVRWNPKRKMWHVEINSIMLYKFLQKAFAEMKPFLEHCNRCASAFLRGFFDGEGSSSEGTISCYNTNLNLLRFVQSILESRFGLEAEGPHKSGRPPGSKVLIKGVLHNVNKQG